MSTQSSAALVSGRFRSGLRKEPGFATGARVRTLLKPRAGVPLPWQPDEVFVLSLERRRDRLERFTRNLANSGWPWKPPEVFAAVDGRTSAARPGWRLGPGAWGCLQSHRRILETVLRRRASSALILEDDAEFPADFVARAERFMAAVPTDWDGLMFGGDHEASTPEHVCPGVIRCLGTVRMHCHAIRGRAISDALDAYRGAGGHSDRLLADLMHRMRFYAPDPFIVAQAAGRSDIDGGSWPSRFAQKAANP